MHSNTVFYLPTSNSVARINMGIDGARRVAASLTATQWLAQQGFATVRPRANRAVAHNGVVVSFWEYEETVEADRSLTALARLLRELHSCRDIDLDLPVMASPALRRGAGPGRPPGRVRRERLRLAVERDQCLRAAMGRLRRLSRRLGGNRARCAVARSILVIISLDWHLLNDPAARFRDLAPDWHARSGDRDRKIRTHVRQLQALGLDVSLTTAA